MKSSILEGSVSAAVGEWFLKSGIQEASGGVARYYLSDLRQNAPISAEITAYSASTLVELYAQSAQISFLDAALRACRFLVETAWDETSLAMRFERSIDGTEYSYFFDAGIIVRGLLSVWRECGHQQLL